MTVISRQRSGTPVAKRRLIALSAVFVGTFVTLSCEGAGGTAPDNSAGATLCVGCPSVYRVGVDPREATILSGETVQLTAETWNPLGVSLNRPVTWTSSTSLIATVSTSGLVTGTGSGAATITATAEGQSGTATVQVNSPPP